MAGIHIVSLRMPQEMWEKLEGKGIKNKTGYIINAVKEKIEREGDER
jgi:hypothetical protein